MNGTYPGMGDLILTGYVGTGKTTIGRLLAARYGIEFIDTDGEIERRAGMSIAEYWARHGEPAFRDLEAQVFSGLLGAGSDRVIATGAGLLIEDRNREVLGPDQRVICLTCAPNELRARLWSTRAERPHLATVSAPEFAAAVEERLERRRPIYDRYETVETGGRSPQEAVEELGRRLDLSVAGTLTVETQRRTELVFYDGALDDLGAILTAHELRGDILLLSDYSIDQAGWNAVARAQLDHAGYTVHSSSVPSGEEHKTLATVERWLACCMDHHLDRDAIVIGLGGGVVGDMAGFLAATYLRGLRLILVPTTLLAQVDAAIGGKVGVDLAGAKNLVGAFHPARLVIADPAVLKTLPAATLSDGLAEIVKTAWMLSVDLLDRVESLSKADAILESPNIIRRTAQEKLRVVAGDPYERGDRALLNFGHTVGHAIEAASEYRLSHGQAISVGMIAETLLAVDLELCRPDCVDRLGTLLQRINLPHRAPGLDPEIVFRFMRQDKKRRDGVMRFALPAAPGHGIVAPVDETAARRAITYSMGGQR